MVTIQASIRRGFLRALYRSGALAGASLAETLEAFQVNGFGAVKTGRLVVTYSGSGQSTSFELPSVGRGFTQDQVFGLSEEFLQIYADTVSALGIIPQGTDNDLAIFNAMMADDRMQSITRIRDSFTLLNLNPSGPVTQ